MILSFADRLDLVIDALLAQDGAGGKALSKNLAYSVSQTYRLFRALMNESPMAFRRRLRLERAAWLLRAKEPIWKIALDSGYSSQEAFSRAFARAFRVGPQTYRRLPSPVEFLPAENRIHFWRGSVIRTLPKPEINMNLAERLIRHDLWMTNQMLDAAKTLTDVQLDELQENKQSLREILARLVFTKEMWLSAVYGRPYEEPSDRTPKGMQERWRLASPEFEQLFADVESQNRWDEQFIDAVCEPPETFSFGGAFAHMITYTAARRMAAAAALKRFEIEIETDPISWERSLK